MMISGRAELQQPLEAVVAVDDAAVEVVQVARREAAAIELHHRPQVRRQHRQHREDHPRRLVAGLAQRLDDLEPLRRLLAALAGGRVDLALQLLAQLLDVDAVEDLAGRFGAHAGLEDAAVAVLQLLVTAPR